VCGAGLCASHLCDVMPSVFPSFRGPLVLIGLGGGFAVIGTVPVAVAMSLGVRSSSTIIGVGFIGFGLLLTIPGFCWCFVIQLHSCQTWWRRRKELTSSTDRCVSQTERRHVIGGESCDHEQEDTPTLEYSICYCYKFTYIIININNIIFVF